MNNDNAQESSKELEGSKFCPLWFYRGIVRKFPRPTPIQIDNFVELVSRSRKWYKYLPLMPPGVTFHFFINPSDDFCMTTDYYCSEFARLAYHPALLPAKRFTRSSVVEYEGFPCFSTNKGECHRLPSEIEEICSAELTGVIHSEAATFWNYDYIHEDNHEWPKESGGDETFRRILEASAEMDEDKLNELLLPERQRLQTLNEEQLSELIRLKSNGNPERIEKKLDSLITLEWNRLRRLKEEKLDKLLLPERRRQKNSCTDAINRMLALVYDEG